MKITTHWMAIYSIVIFFVAAAKSLLNWTMDGNQHNYTNCHIELTHTLFEIIRIFNVTDILVEKLILQSHTTDNLVHIVIMLNCFVDSVAFADRLRKKSESSYIGHLIRTDIVLAFSFSDPDRPMNKKKKKKKEERTEAAQFIGQ